MRNFQSDADGIQKESTKDKLLETGRKLLQSGMELSEVARMKGLSPD